MTIKFNVPGQKRKALAEEIGQWLGLDARYIGVPSCAYGIGEHRIEKDGTLILNALSDEATERLLQHLYDAGYEFQMPDISPQTAEAEPEEGSLCIQIPRSTISDSELELVKKLIAGKASLIQKATGAAKLNVEANGDVVCFPWFDAMPGSDMIRAVSVLITKLAAMAKDMKRVNTVDHAVENERYAFRCFLLRLGFIGDEYKAERKTLLRNLSGSAAFKSGRKEEA